MTTRFLLDTTVLSQLIRDPRGTVGTRLRKAGDSNVFNSIIVACELRYGARKRASAALTERCRAFACQHRRGAARIGRGCSLRGASARARSKGTPIGSNDLRSAC